jgi:predicted anti-sigma-YlaC factor YlaD
MLNCDEIARLVSESLDRDLSPLERVGVRVHLLYCKACRRYRGHIRFLRLAAVRLASELGGVVPAATETLPSEARDRIRAAIAGAEPDKS